MQINLQAKECYPMFNRFGIQLFIICFDLIVADCHISHHVSFSYSSVSILKLNITKANLCSPIVFLIVKWKSRKRLGLQTKLEDVKKSGIVF